MFEQITDIEFLRDTLERDIPEKNFQEHLDKIVVQLKEKLVSDGFVTYSVKT